MNDIEMLTSPSRSLYVNMVIRDCSLQCMSSMSISGCVSLEYPTANFDVTDKLLKNPENRTITIQSNVS